MPHDLRVPFVAKQRDEWIWNAFRDKRTDTLWKSNEWAMRIQSETFSIFFVATGHEILVTCIVCRADL